MSRASFGSRRTIGVNRYRNHGFSMPSPWSDVHLTKEERRGKTFEEMQELRKIKWGRDERGAPQTELFPEAQEDK